MVSSGRVDIARAPRAAVVKLSAQLNRAKHSPKNRTPMPMTPAQSRPLDQGLRSQSATGSSRTKPEPKRRAASVTGSVDLTIKRMNAVAPPPIELDSMAIRMPIASSISALPHARDEVCSRRLGARNYAAGNKRCVRPAKSELFGCREQGISRNIGIQVRIKVIAHGHPVPRNLQLRFPGHRQLDGSPIIPVISQSIVGEDK